MRITGGTLRGRVIEAPEGKGARYTSSKVRQALFNILGDMEGKDILDLFSGAGSFTIEALSRGATSATLVENDQGRLGILRKNLQSLDLNKYCQVLDMDVRYAIPLLCTRGATFDVIFMDPPYEKGYPAETMLLLQKYSIHRRDTVIVVEHSIRETIPFSDFPEFVPVKTKRYGDTAITVLTAFRP